MSFKIVALLNSVLDVDRFDSHLLDDVESTAKLNAVLVRCVHPNLDLDANIRFIISIANFSATFPSKAPKQQVSSAITYQLEVILFRA